MGCALFHVTCKRRSTDIPFVDITYIEHPVLVYRLTSLRVDTVGICPSKVDRTPYYIPSFIGLTGKT